MKPANGQRSFLPLAAALALASCNSATEGNAASPPEAAPAQAAAAGACAMPRLDFRAAAIDAAARQRFTDRFRAAFDRACAEGMFEKRPLVDERSLDRETLFVMNAPQANVTSIYFGPSAAPPAMLLESPLVTDDGQVNIPSADELHEAIYCAVVGATEAEQEESGRCLPD